VLVPGRTRRQCQNRWRNKLGRPHVLDPCIDHPSRRTGSWTAEEKTKLKDAVQAHGGKDWDAITALVPGRTKVQCYHKCRDTHPSMDWESGRKGKWLEDEDSKLKDAVQTHGDNN
jgi:hypothetical protein